MKLRDAKIDPFVQVGVDPEPNEFRATSGSEQSADASKYAREVSCFNFAMDAPQSRGKEHRDAFVRNIQWRQEMQQRGLWDEQKEMPYQAVRAEEIAYWKLFMTPTAESSEKRLVAWFADTWSLRTGRQWPLELIRVAKQELGLEL